MAALHSAAVPIARCWPTRLGVQMNNTRWKGLEEIVELDPAGESAVSRPFLDLFPAVSQAGWSNHLHLHRTANTRAARGVAAAGQIAGLRVHYPRTRWP